ncbi:MAG: ABC transporter substrate-binding protein [Mesorhizobium sp.]|uniref:substrate-binding domain-containing protein n=1 Tax=Mesorhizobium sp. TaxID=1871066 RepID=UPI0012196EF4|nr:substrate-binding domain-containing protein [Mesorhizobium sp.]TIN95514.1 MAG: ABC transporter substrate-binding protein [Mesorhizobium sp.]TJU97161.1 MAG: ABC transporter substrate-binding protein [Mesorhizobium sp.]
MNLKNAISAAVLSAGVCLAATSHAEEQKIVIGVSIPAADHGWTGGLDFHAEQAIKRLEKQYPNVEIILKTASNATEQVNVIEDMNSGHKLTALVVLPFESAPLTAPVKDIHSQGVYVTVVDRGLSEDGIEDFHIAGDNPALGREAALYINSRLPQGGSVVAMRGLPTEIDNQRVEGFKTALAGNIKILDEKHSNWNRDEGFAVMQDYLQRFPHIDAVWTQDDDTTLGVIDAARQAGREGEFFIVGGGGMKQVVQMVKDGSRKDVPVTVSYPPSMIATAIELTAEHFVSKIPLDGRYILNTSLITKENADLFYFPDSPY